jgi:hypothetical protein
MLDKIREFGWVRYMRLDGVGGVMFLPKFTIN